MTAINDHNVEEGANGAIFIDGIQATLPRGDLDVREILSSYFATEMAKSNVEKAEPTVEIEHAKGRWTVRKLSNGRVVVSHQDFTASVIFGGTEALDRALEASPENDWASMGKQLLSEANKYSLPHGEVFFAGNPRTLFLHLRDNVGSTFYSIPSLYRYSAGHMPDDGEVIRLLNLYETLEREAPSSATRGDLDDSREAL